MVTQDDYTKQLRGFTKEKLSYMRYFISFVIRAACFVFLLIGFALMFTEIDLIRWLYVVIGIFLLIIMFYFLEIEDDILQELATRKPKEPRDV